MKIILIVLITLSFGSVNAQTTNSIDLLKANKWCVQNYAWFGTDTISLELPQLRRDTTGRNVDEWMLLYFYKNRRMIWLDSLNEPKYFEFHECGVGVPRRTVNCIEMVDNVLIIETHEIPWNSYEVHHDWWQYKVITWKEDEIVLKKI